MLPSCRVLSLHQRLLVENIKAVVVLFWLELWTRPQLHESSATRLNLILKKQVSIQISKPQLEGRESQLMALSSLQYRFVACERGVASYSGQPCHMMSVSDTGVHIRRHDP